MKTISLILAAALIFSSCKKEEKEILTKENRDEDDTSTELTIVDEDFIDNPFEFGKVTVDNLRHEFTNIKIEREPIKNLHIKNQIDSILTVRINNSEFILYKLPKEQFLESATIRDKDIKLNKDIHVGITKEQFKEKFDSLRGKKSLPSKILVGRKETQEYLIFTFSNNRLKEIEYNGYVD